MNTRAERIVLVTQSVAFGGMETQCVDLTVEFVRRGLQVAVVLPESAVFDALATRAVRAGAQVERLDTDARNGRPGQLVRIGRLLGFLHAWRPDVVHVHTGGASGGVAVVAAARLATRATVVLTEHDVPYAEPGRRLWLATGVRDFFLHALVTLSSRNAAARRTWLGAPESKFVGIRPGIPMGAPPPTDPGQRLRIRSLLGLEAAGTVIGCVVRLAPGKGLDNLIRAFALVLREEACELLLVGDGPLRSSLETLAVELGVSDSLRFSGLAEEPGPLLGAMDLFVLAVPAGSGSIALLEAMARGLPAIITFCGPGEFLVPDETGLCAPPNDPARLAEVIKRLVRDPNLRGKLGAEACDHARRHFRMERVAAQLLEVYASARARAIPEHLLARSLDAT